MVVLSGGASVLHQDIFVSYSDESFANCTYVSDVVGRGDKESAARLELRKEAKGVGGNSVLILPVELEDIGLHGAPNVMRGRAYICLE